MANTAWEGKIPEEKQQVYLAVIDAAIRARIPFALGGAFALAAHTGAWRDTKDLDLYLMPRHHRRMVALIRGLGLKDYYDTIPYDRQWIYRATSDGVIVDVMRAMANHRAKVDEWWLSGPEIEIGGRTVRALRAEAMVWDKLYIMQRERCDWPDLLNLLQARGTELDWREILKRLGSDAPLLTGALSVFRWISPGAAVRMPKWLWKRVNLSPMEERSPGIDRRRTALLDSRPWFAPQKRHYRTA